MKISSGNLADIVVVQNQMLWAPYYELLNQKLLDIIIHEVHDKEPLSKWAFHQWSGHRSGLRVVRRIPSELIYNSKLFFKTRNGLRPKHALTADAHLTAVDMFDSSRFAMDEIGQSSKWASYLTKPNFLIPIPVNITLDIVHDYVRYQVLLGLTYKFDELVTGDYDFWPYSELLNIIRLDSKRELFATFDQLLV